MRNACFRIVRSWGTKSRLNIAEYLWILSMFGVLAGLENNQIGLYLIPPFGATLTILIDLPQARSRNPMLWFQVLLSEPPGERCSACFRVGPLWPFWPQSWPSASLT
jgi:hypothetical protein